MVQKLHSNPSEKDVIEKCIQMLKDQFIQTLSANSKDDQFMTSAYFNKGNQYICLVGESQAPDDEEATINSLLINNQY